MELSLGKYIDAIADYISMEYRGINLDSYITFQEKQIVKKIILSHYQYSDSINNTANEIVKYLRNNRENKNV